MNGKFVPIDEQRIALLGMLLENMGLDAVLRLGDLDRWKEAVEAALAARSRS